MNLMERAYKVAALAVRRRMREQRPEHLAVLDSIGLGTVGVYRGTYDRVENILELLGIRYVANPSYLRKPGIIFANCSSAYEPGLAEHVRARVQQGAWLVGSGWALGKLIAPAFPGTVRPAARVTGDEVVSVEPTAGSIWSDMEVPGADPQWWLEGNSQPIEVLDPDLVSVEAVSPEMLLRYKAPAVAVRFDWGRGKVFHMASHFWCRQSRTPTDRHCGPASDFLRSGMGLCDEAIDEIFDEAGIAPEMLNFAMIQSAATTTELVARLCGEALQGASIPEPQERGAFRRLFSADIAGRVA
jgi:hypothetical protein